MKKYTTLVGWALLLGVWGGWSVVSQIHAQSPVPGGQIDGFTFFIPFPAENIDDRFAEDRPDDQVKYLNQNFEYTISIAVLNANTIVYYDEWEDGLEPNLTSPEQPSTKIWGDADTTNNGPGGSVTFTPPGGGVLSARTVITLRNPVPTTNPRDPSQIFFDGGDKLTAVGGKMAVAMMVWPDVAGIDARYADAWELYPTSRWGDEYIVPIGENLTRNLSTIALPPPPPPPLCSGDLTLANSFRTVSVNVQAVVDNTTVEIDLDGDGNADVSQLLNQGQQILQSNINAGARVQANVAGNSAPVQVVVIASDPCRAWEMRGYTLVPRAQWTSDYLAPRASDGDFWLYNPNNSDLVVSAQTITGTTAITIPALSTGRYPPPVNPPPGAPLLGFTGVRFTANEDFYGVAALDSASAQDWGYALQPTNLETAQTLVGLGLGNINSPPDGDQSQVFVTALSDTTIQVTHANGSTFSVPVIALQETPIVDPGNPLNNFNLTGAFLTSTNGVPFASVWGQRDGAPTGDPSIDAGTSIVPLPSLGLQTTFGPKLDSVCNGVVNLGDTIQLKLQYFNNSINPIPNIIVTNMLPPEVTYQPNTTLLNGALIPDDSSGATPFPLDEGGFNAGDAAPLSNSTLTFDVVIIDVSNVIINRANVASADLPLESDSVAILVVVAPQPGPPLLEINKVLIDPADGIVTNGQTITFGLTITNTSNSPMTTLQLEDTFNANHLTFLNAGPPPDLVASGVITWNDLTSTFGDLLPGATISATVSFAVGQLSPTITNTLNAVVVEVQRSNTPALLTCPASAIVGIAEPAIHVKKATNGFDADNPNNDPVPQIKPGDPVTWDYVVTNIGNVPLSNVTLIDDQLALLGVTPSFIGGDTNNDNKLDLDETWLYRATGVAEDLPNSNRPRGQCGPGGFEAPLYTNMATATGEFGPTTVIDDDPSHYCPPPPPPGCQGDCTPPTPPPPPPPTPPLCRPDAPPPAACCLSTGNRLS